MPIGSVTPAGFNGSVGWLGGTNFGAAEPNQFRFTDSDHTSVPQRIQDSLDLSSSFRGIASNGRERIKQLVGEVREALQQRAGKLRSAAAGASTYGQTTIESALTEMATLVGARYQPGGAENASVTGRNPKQVSAVQIGSLPPNGTLTISGKLVSRTQTTPVPTVSHAPPRSANYNPDQITTVNSSALSEGSTVAFSGTVDHASSAAELTYEGASGTVTGSATFRLVGPDGNVSLAVTAGENLTDVATRINDHTNTTGVIADVQGDTIKLSTTAKGATAAISIDNVQQARDIVTTGVNNSQVDAFQVSHISDNSQFQINGTITQAASRATLTYSGDINGNVTDTARFTLRGALGSANITITQGESLDDVAGRINQKSNDTGIEAVRSGTDLLLKATTLGSQGTASVELTEISQYLNVAGVNPSQFTGFQVTSAQPASQNGLVGDVTQLAGAAALTYDGLSGNIAADADFVLTGSLGSINVNVLEGDSLTTIRDRINNDTNLTGVAATVTGDQLSLQSTTVGSNTAISVSVTTGAFAVTGGNGDGTANGVDAMLTINGQNIVANGNQVSYSDALGSYTFTVATSTLGAFDPITITSTNGTFAITGGDGQGHAVGVDAAANLNGQSFVATGNTFSLDFSGETFQLQSANGFTGTIDPIEISSTLEPFTISGGDGNGTAHGSDMAANINGQALTSTDGSFTVTTPRGNVVITFDNSFTGGFDPFAIHVASIGNPPPDLATKSERYAVLNGVVVKEQRGSYHYREKGVEVALVFAQGFKGDFDPITVSTEAPPHPVSSFSLSQGDATQIGRLVAPLFQLLSPGNANDSGSRIAQDLEVTTRVLQQLNAFDLLTYDPLLRSELTNSVPFIDRLA